jgi:hypothetical protein
MESIESIETIESLESIGSIHSFDLRGCIPSRQAHGELGVNVSDRRVDRSQILGFISAG